MIAFLELVVSLVPLFWEMFRCICGVAKDIWVSGFEVFSWREIFRIGTFAMAACAI